MSTTGLRPFDNTVQLTNHWLQEIMQEMHWEDRQRAYHGLRAVLHALRDRLSVEEAAHFSAQLPMLVRGIYFEGWHPAGKPLKQRSREEFLASIAESFERDPLTDPVRLSQSVFKVIENHVTAGEVEDVKACLPQPIRSLWP